MQTRKEAIHCKYVDSLPRVNLSGGFLIKKEAFETLAEDWLSFINFFIRNDIPDSSSNSKNPLVKFKQNYQLNSNDFIGASDRVSEVFGLKGTLGVISLKKIDNSYKFIAQLSYNDLITLLGNEDSINLGNLLKMHTMIDRFLIYQYSNGKLLFPITKSKELVSRNYPYKHYFLESSIVELFSEFMQHKSTSTHSYYTGILIYLLSCINPAIVDNISNEDLKFIETYVVDNGIDASKQGDSYLFILNELRRMLVLSGRKDIEAPVNRKSIATGVDKSDPTRFLANVINIDINPNLEDILHKAVSYLLQQKNDGLAADTIKGKAYDIKTFLVYLVTYHGNRKIDVDLINEIFNSMNDLGIQKYVKENRGSELSTVLSEIARFLKYGELLTPYVLKNIPRVKKIKKISARKAMPKHMLRHLLDIVLHRPPKTNTRWDSKKADISWWHTEEVYPVFPMMILIHLFIPLRGSQIRNLCRKRSFEFDEEGNISTIIVNTDKNTGRSYLQEIPNVWDELSILSNFIKWHKEYFPHLPEVDYNGDDSSRWEKIVPLMITPKIFKPITQHTHMNYFKRVLLRYQIEVNEKYIQKGDKKRIQILWAKNGTDTIPKTIEELDGCTDTYFSKLDAMYDIHSMRVTGATRYLEAGLGISLVMKLTGHTSPDMLLNVYNKLQLEEKRELLATAVNKIFLTDGKDTLENLQNFLLDEIPNNYDLNKPEGINKAFEENGLFSLDRKSSSDSKGSTQIDKGTELARFSHPSSWTPMIFGICPGVKCPDGRENRCSLCPYLITGKLFLDGVIHQANLKLIKFYRLSKEMQEEEGLGYENSGKGENIDLLFEEVMGWFEIIQIIEDNIYENKKLPVNQDNQIIGTQIVPPEASYLQTNYNAFQMGVEKDHHGLAILMIKAVNFCRKNAYKDIDKALESEQTMIDWMMAIYTNKKEKNNLLSSFIEQVTY